MEQRTRRSPAGARQSDAGGALTGGHRDDRGLATLETTLAITILVPILFAILGFGAALERWLAQDAATVQAARYAGEIGGDSPALRAFVADQLRSSRMDPAAVTIEIAPPHVGWREPIRVSLSSQYTVAIPFLVTMTMPLRSSAISRGEVNR